jgi:uncharacterized damage-inducible protein DinB
VPHYDLSWSAELHPEIGTLVSTLQDSTREWRENLGTPSLEAVTWSPYENGPSIGGLILHMASAELYWLQDIGEQQKSSDDEPSVAYDQTLDQYAPHWPTPPSQPIEWYFSVQDDVRARMLELVTKRNDPASQHQTKRSTMSYRWILAHLVEHDSYTGGQAVLLHEMYKKMAS